MLTTTPEKALSLRPGRPRCGRVNRRRALICLLPAEHRTPDAWSTLEDWDRLAGTVQLVAGWRR